MKSRILEFRDSLHIQIHPGRIGVLPSEFVQGTNHKTFEISPIARPRSRHAC
jgi:hypothetical protein